MLHTDDAGPYHIARAANFESVDSFYCPRTPTFLVKRKLLLFQMDVLSTNPVKGEGIVALLKSVGWLDRAVKDPVSRVALVFVCPDDSEKIIDRKQPIHWTSAADGESIIIIPGIGGETMEALAKVNVKTLGDFRRKVSELKQSSEEWLVECVVKFERFEERLEEEMLSMIPQYVWKM